jgi:serine/threonine protein kinase
VIDVTELSGRSVQGWVLGALIGKGADGVVYDASSGDQTAAVKIYFPDAIEKNGGMDSAMVRLDLQLSLVGKKHPHLVEVHGGGLDSDLGTLYLIMEKVSGNTLDKVVRNFPRGSIPKLLPQLAEACRYLESIDLVHRDIKPANIMVSDDFEHLTLLDLSIIHRALDDDEQGRLSGEEFVATLRYSPPEFVWRTEEAAEDGAWRAITFYQMGATLHDMIMQHPLFEGFDKPHACLYDCVRDRTPTIECGEIDDWIIQAVKACLLKDWRQRLSFVTWEDFSPPALSDEGAQQEKRIRLRQVQNQETIQAKKRQPEPEVAITREQALWTLNNRLILEVRNYLFSTPIFPKCSVVEKVISEHEYTTLVVLEKDIERGLEVELKISITLTVDNTIRDATNLILTATRQTAETSISSWTELFSVDSAFRTVKQAILDAVESNSYT